MHSPLSLAHKNVEAEEKPHMLLPSVGHGCNTNSTIMDKPAVVIIAVGTLCKLLSSLGSIGIGVRECNESIHGKKPKAGHYLTE